MQTFVADGVTIGLDRIATAEIRAHAAERLIRRLDPATTAVGRRCQQCGSGEHGVPTVAGSAAHFSISFSGGWVAASMADRRHGLDIEADDGREFISLAALSPAEQTALARIPTNRYPAFLRLWTAKEAIAKSMGRGLLDDPADRNCAQLLLTAQAMVSGLWVSALPLPFPIIGTVAVA